MDGVTHDFRSNKALSAGIRATTPEQIKAAVTELQRISQTKRDYLVPTRQLNFHVEDGGVVASFPGATDSILGDARLRFGVGDWANSQLAEYLGIHGTYAKRLRTEAPDLLATNLNYWAERANENRLVRTLDGRVRAVLSDRYKIFDSSDHFFAAGKAALSHGAELHELLLSERKFLARFVQPGAAAKIVLRGDQLKGEGKLFSSGYRRDDGTWGVADDDDPNGDWVFGALTTGTSDVGDGSYWADFSIYRATCSNYILGGITIRRIHVGKKQDDLGLVTYSQDTIEAQARAAQLEVRDQVAAVFDPENFKAVVAKLQGLAHTELEHPVEVVKAVGERYGFSEAEQKNILDELVRPSRGLNAGITGWGLVNAITVGAHGADTVDKAADAAAIGGKVVDELPAIIKDAEKLLVAVR